MLNDILLRKLAQVGLTSPLDFLGQHCHIKRETYRALQGMKQLLDKMKRSGIIWKGDLAFVNDWELFWSGKPCLLICDLV